MDTLKDDLGDLEIRKYLGSFYSKYGEQIYFRKEWGCVVDEVGEPRLFGISEIYFHVSNKFPSL